VSILVLVDSEGYSVAMSITNTQGDSTTYPCEDPDYATRCPPEETLEFSSGFR